MCGRSVASRRIVHVGSALGCCSVASASGPDRTFHCASAEAGRIGAIRRSTDHEEENFRAARTIRTLPPLFASVLHERDLRSFQRAAPLHLSVRVRLHDAGQHFRPRVRSGLKWFVNDNLALCFQPSPKKMRLAHNRDRHSRGWFSSQILDFLRRRRTHNTCTCLNPHPELCRGSLVRHRAWAASLSP